MKSADQKPLSQDVNTRKARPAGGNVAVVAAVVRVVDVLGSWRRVWQLLLCLFPFEYDFWPRINVSANITATGLSRGSTRISLAQAEQTRQDTLRYALNINQVNFLRQRIQFLGKRLTGDCQRCPDGQQHNSDTNSNSNTENNKQLVTRLNFSIHFAPRHTLRMRNATDTFSAFLLIIRSPFAQRHLITLYVRLSVCVCQLMAANYR